MAYVNKGLLKDKRKKQSRFIEMFHWPKINQNKPLPASVDWRLKGFVNRVKGISQDLVKTIVNIKNK